MPADRMKKLAVADPLAPQKMGGGRTMVCPGRQPSEPAREDARQAFRRRVAERIVEVPRGLPPRNLVLCQPHLPTPTFEEAGNAGHVGTALVAGHRPVGKVAADGGRQDGVQASGRRCLVHR